AEGDVHRELAARAAELELGREVGLPPRLDRDGAPEALMTRGHDADVAGAGLDLVDGQVAVSVRHADRLVVDEYLGAGDVHRYTEGSDPGRAGERGDVPPCRLSQIVDISSNARD